MLGVVGVFKTGKNTSFAFALIFDGAFLLRSFGREGNDRVILTLRRTFVSRGTWNQRHYLCCFRYDESGEGYPVNHMMMWMLSGF